MRFSCLLAIGISLLSGAAWVAVPPNSTTGPGSGTRSTGATTPPEGSPWVTRQSTFNIPFSVNPATAATAVELYVSRDQGQTWQRHSTQQPAMGQFQFRGSEAGEYWFASRTITADRPPTDLQQLKPELHVIVDLDEPQLGFEVKVGPVGQIEVSWQVSDATLDPSTLKIEYQSQVGQRWRPVVVDHRRMRLTDNGLVGAMNWRPDPGSTAIQVRAEVSDRAGNKSVVNRMALLPTNQPPPTTAEGGVPSDPFLQARKLAQSAIPWPTDNRLPDPGPGAPIGAPDSARQEHFVGRTNSPPSELTSQSGPTPPAYLPNNGPLRAGTREVPRQPVESEFQQQLAVHPGASSNNPSSLLPPGEQARMTRAREFRLDYQVESEGPSGIRKIELWGTADGGNTWSLWQLDEDQTSPVEVKVDNEGVYGFRVVVVANNGLAGTAPRNGDAADLWVGVDSSVPEARITTAAYGNDSHFGQLDIRWDAGDSWLAETPITLLYSDQPNGPWTTIRSGLPNSGQHFWPIEPRIPDRIYLRIEVRDRAGNVGSHQLDQPVLLSGLFPKARIQGLAP
jgi:hypothetical protein